MKRCIGFAVLGLLLVPDWAAACWPLWGPPAPAPFYAPPCYCPPPVYYVPVCPPTYVYPPVIYPSIVPTSPTFTPAPAIKPIPMEVPSSGPAKPGKTGGVGKTQSTAPSIASPPAALTTPTPPKTIPVLPAAGSDPIAPMPKTTALPATNDPLLPAAKLPGGLPPLELPKEPEPTRKGTGSPTPRTVPAATPTPAPGESPTPTGKTSTVPAAPEKTTAVPGSPPAKTPTLPGTTVPAIPSPAPDPLLPVGGPSLPSKSGAEGLPAITLPPEVPVKPSSTSRSSPLADGKTGMRVQVFPTVNADFRGGVYRTVTFYNHTPRDLALVIEGRSVKLPAKTYVETKLSPTFEWSHGDAPAARERVPDGAAGLDVVFRDE